MCGCLYEGHDLRQNIRTSADLSETGLFLGAVFGSRVEGEKAKRDDETLRKLNRETARS